MQKIEPKEMVDVGRVEVLVTLECSVDRGEGYEDEIEFTCYGTPEHDATDVALDFVVGTEPMNVGDGVYVPRHQVMCYKIGERGKYFVDK